MYLRNFVFNDFILVSCLRYRRTSDFSTGNEKVSESLFVDEKENKFSPIHSYFPSEVAFVSKGHQNFRKAFPPSDSSS